MMKLKTKKTSIKGSRIIIKNKKIRTGVEIQTIKMINI